VITDYAENLQRLGRIIAAMDNPGATDVEVVVLRHAVASDMAALAQRLADGSSGSAVVPGAAGSGVTVLADARSNSLIIRAPNPARLASTRAIIEKLDRPMGDDGPGGNIYVVYLKNADAVKLAAVLRAAYGGGGSNSGSSGSSSGSFGSSSSQGLSQTAQTGRRQQPELGLVDRHLRPRPPRRCRASAGPSTGGFVQADPATNSLIITARADVPPAARRDRPARLAPRAGLCGIDDRQGRCQQGRPPSACSGKACSATAATAHRGRRHQFRNRLGEHHQGTLAVAQGRAPRAQPWPPVAVDRPEHRPVAQEIGRFLHAWCARQLPGEPRRAPTSCPRPIWWRWTTRKPRS
jgi:hypothetical protein